MAIKSFTNLVKIESLYKKKVAKTENYNVKQVYVHSTIHPKEKEC